MATLTIQFTPVSPPPANGYRVRYRALNAGAYTTVSPNPTSSPVVIRNLPENTSYEGLVESACSDDQFSAAQTFLAMPATSIAYGCGETIQGAHTGAGEYVYPYYNLLLLGEDKVTFTVNAFTAPVKITILDSAGGVVANSSWIGSASYVGPWGNSLTATGSKTLSFNRSQTLGDKERFKLQVSTVHAGTASTATFNTSIACVTPDVIVVTPPTLPAIPDYTYTVNAPVNITFPAATDSQPGLLTYILYNIAPGLSFDPGNRILTGSSALASVNNMRLEVTNQTTRLSASSNFVFTLNPVSVPTTEPAPVFAYKHYGEVEDTPVTYSGPPLLAGNYSGSLDVGTCEVVSGWAAKRDELNTTVGVDIYLGNSKITTVAANQLRQDVADAITSTTNSYFGFRYDIPPTYRNGTTLEWHAYIANTSIELTYSPKTSETCSGGAPTRIKIYIEGADTLQEAGIPQYYTLKELMSNGSVNTLTPLSWGFTVNGDNPVPPAGIVMNSSGMLTPGTNNTTIASNLQGLVNASYGGVLYTLRVQIVDATCSRPATGLTSYHFVYNIQPSGQDARLFTSLSDAVNSAGAKFDESAPAFFDPFEVQFGTLAVGQTVYIGSGTSCAVASDNIYYVLNASAGDTIKKAVKVVNGVITEISTTVYTPVPAPNAPDPTTVPAYIGTAALNVVFATVPSGAAVTMDYLCKIRLLTPNLDDTGSSVERSPDPAIRFKKGNSVTNAAWFAAPYQSRRKIDSYTKYDSFIWDIDNLIAAYPTATTLDFEVTVRRKPDPVTGQYASDASYRVLQVNFFTHKNYGVLPQPVDDSSGADYYYAGETYQSLQYFYRGDSVQGVLIPVNVDYAIGHIKLDLVARTGKFTELVEPSPGVE